MPAPPVVTLGPLPSARVGLDYGLPSARVHATGGVLPYIFSLAPGAGGLIPAGLVIDPSTGLLSGKVTAPAGLYRFFVTATDAQPLAGTANVELFVSDLPNGLDLVGRTQVRPDPSIDDSCVIDALNVAAAGALQLLTDLTEIPFPDAPPSQIVALSSPILVNFVAALLPAFADESPWVRSYSPRCTTKAWPVRTLDAATLVATPLRIGTFKELLTGIAQICIDQDGEYLRTARQLFGGDGNAALFVSYTAGFLRLPADLTEAWAHLALLLYLEKERTGVAETHIDRLNIKYDRKYPEQIKAILSRWRRSHLG